MTRCIIRPFGTLLVILAACIIISCNKEISSEGSQFNTGPDLTTKVSSSVSGFVTDENNTAVEGAAVNAGSITVMTDRYGYFEIKDVLVVKNAAVVTVNKAGYFKGIKTYAAVQDKAAFFRIKLIPKINVGSFNASTGGIISLSNGLIISAPAEAVVNILSNAAYTGTVNVAAYWLNPEDQEIDLLMPGDLRGLDASGSLKGLTTFGMVAVELTGSGGESLQIADGKKVGLTFPLSGSVMASAPSSIPLWYFDEAKGLWKEEGSAIKSGNSYVGEVSHFSWWNCDLPNAIVPLTFTVVDVSGNPLGNVHVEITPTTTNSWSHVGGWTDATGYVSVFVTPNTNYLLQLFTDCGNTTIQNFSVGTQSVNLGNIIVPTAMTSSISGTVTDCSNNPVTNGFVMVQLSHQYHRYALNSSGAFDFSILFCSSTPAILVAEDLTNSQQSTPLNYTLNNGANVIGNIQACGITTQQFINFTVNGTPYSFIYPTDSIGLEGNTNAPPGTFNRAWVSGNRSMNNDYVTIQFTSTAMALNSMQALDAFTTSYISDSTGIINPISINITEFGSIGAFLSGNFTGTFTGAPPANLTYNVTCNFRVRRIY